mmetsp:Transcript_13971/g.48235  ORF Transcript_13971/g.48235 Transcript_13971/m.48235 type:complete len:133 (-) Transcript_13971:439-837(-)
MSFYAKMNSFLRRFPRPPFAEQRFWDKTYDKAPGGIEWGIEPGEMLKYSWTPVPKNKTKLMTGTLTEICPKTSKVLDLGCGSSMLSFFLAHEGWSDITAVDLSPIAISQCKQRAGLMGIENIDFVVADCRRF